MQLLTTAPSPQKTFIFVGGMHRSGTTLLASSIAAASGVSGFSGTSARMNEGQFLQETYLPGYEMGGVPAWALDPRSHMTEADASRQAADELWNNWAPYWDLNASHLLEKTPLNLTKTRYLQALFPQSMFVIIMRHPITQALAVMKWQTTIREKLGYRFQDLIENWVVAHENFAADQQHLESCHVIKYEELTRNPLQVAHNLSASLGLDLDTRVFDEFDASKANAYAERWVKRRGRGVAPSSPAPLAHITSWLLKREEAAIYSRFEDRVNAFGYTLTDVHDSKGHIL